MVDQCKQQWWSAIHNYLFFQLEMHRLYLDHDWLILVSQTVAPFGFIYRETMEGKEILIFFIQA